MTEECITPLRRRMIEDMSVRHFASKTQHDYIRTVMKLTRFLGRSPDTATNEDLRRFQLHLTENRAGAPIINSTVSALRFFFTVTLGRADAARHLTFVHEPRKLPVVLSPEEVARLLEAAPGVKYKAALSVAYGAGLRVSEVVSLKVSDIDSKRMMLRVEQGKGGKDRHAMLSPQLLELLRDWWRIARPQVWLFPGLDPINPMSMVTALVPLQPKRILKCCTAKPPQRPRLHAQKAARRGLQILGTFPWVRPAAGPNRRPSSPCSDSPRGQRSPPS